MIKCPTCGHEEKIVNECGCDPNNMPTRSQDTRLPEERMAEIMMREAEAHHAPRRTAQRRERFALSIFKILIQREEGSKLTDYRSFACEAVEAADELARMLDSDSDSPILPAYLP